MLLSKSMPVAMSGPTLEIHRHSKHFSVYIQYTAGSSLSAFIY